jgi:hypothetical protein
MKVVSMQPITSQIVPVVGPSNAKEKMVNIIQTPLYSEP